MVDVNFYSVLIIYLFSRASGGRTRTRTLDPLIKSQQSRLKAIAMIPIWQTAADIELLADMRVLLPELLSQFEKSSGHKVLVEYGTLGTIFSSRAKCALVSLTHSFQSQSACFALSLRLSS